MCEAKNPLAYRYRKDENNNEYERDLVRFHEARKSDILIHPISGKPLIKKAIDSIRVTPHFAEKTSRINCKEQEIQTELNLKSPEDMSHDFAAGLIKKAFNDGLNIRIYTKACGKHYSETPINLNDLPYRNSIIQLEYKMSFQNSHIRWDIALKDEFRDLILGIEVLNTHETAEINRPSNITWAEILSKDIIEKLTNINDINESSYIDFNCQREFTNTDESKKCNACIEDEKRIQEEQETRRKEIEKIKKIKEITEINLQNKIIHDNIERERQELERIKREEENINRKIKENEERKRLEIEREKIEEENIKRQKKWEEDEEIRKSILKEEESNLKQATKELEYIQEKIRIHKVAIYNIWLKINDIKRNNVESDELQKLKDDEKSLNNFKIKNKKKEEKLLVDIKQLKATIQINKLPIIKPSLLYV